MNKFDLAIVQPIANSTGKLVCTRTVYAESVSQAVGRTRKEFEGSGYVVMQGAAFNGDRGMTTMTHALLDAYVVSQAAA